MSSTDTSMKAKPRRAGGLRWLGRVALGALVLALVLMIVGAIYQASASASDEKTYRPVEQMVTVDGLQMRLDCRGEGGPTVVLEAGAGVGGLSWARIQEEVAAFTRVCSYDRAGMGWSDSLPEALSPQQNAERLHALLEAGEEGPPYLLVGHSLGGIYVRAFAGLYPDEVAGMALVDSSHENQNLLFPPEFVELNGMQQFGFQFCQATAPYGLVRAVKMMDAFSASLPLTEEEKKPLLAEMNRSAYCGAAAREAGMFNAFANRPKELASLGDMPLVVLYSGHDAQEKYDELPPSFQSQVTLEVMQEEVEAWEAMQAELAGLSTRGKLTVVRESGHNIQLDAPQAVIDAIREVFAQAVK